MIVRPKASADRGELVRLLRACHARDGYPARWPDAPARFVTPDDERGAWVCAHDDAVVGHVALHPARDPVLTCASRATGLTHDQMVTVARLLVSPTARRHGAGTALMTRASTSAHGFGLRPVLDVAKHYAAAIALYEACGWTRADQLTLTFRDGSVVQSWLYVGPAPSALRLDDRAPGVPDRPSGG